jgi:O-antigen ligase
MDVPSSRESVGSPDTPPPSRGLRLALAVVFAIFLASSFFSIAVNSLALGLMAILWIVLMVQERRWGVRPTPLDLWFLAYLAAEVISSLFSVNLPQSFFFARRLLLIGIVYFIVSLVDNEASLRKAVAVMLGSAVAVSLFGVVKLAVGALDATRRLGIFQFYMTTAELMMIAALFLLAFIVQKKTPRKIRILATASIVPILISLFATVTRGAYLGFVAGALVIGLIRNRMLIVPLVVLIVLVVLFAPPFVEQRVQSIIDIQHPENAGRIMIWTAGIRIFADHPLVGVGDIDLGDLLREYADPGYPGLWGHMHNVPLHLLVTLGLLGFAAVTGLFVSIVRAEWKVYRRWRNDWFLGSIPLGALGVLAGLQVHGLTEWTIGDQEAMVLFWTIVGFALAAGRLGAGHAAVSPGPAVPGDSGASGSTAGTGEGRVR